MVFNVTAKSDGNRQRDVTKRFLVAHVEPSAPGGAASLYYLDDNTEITFNNTDSPPPMGIKTVPEESLTPEYIGGLQDQLLVLNLRLRHILHETSAKRAINQGILIHGFEGTGKSLIMEHFERTNFRRVTRLEKSTLDTGMCPPRSK